MIYTVTDPLKEAWGTNDTVNGSAGALVVIPVIHGFREILIEPQAAVRMAFGPMVHGLWFYDNSATTKWIDLAGASKGVIDSSSYGSGGDTGATLDAMQTTDFIYVGARERFSGIYVDMDGTSVNSVVSTMTVQYRKTDDTWASVPATFADGTASGGATLAQDGLITWGKITDWKPSVLNDVLSDSNAPKSLNYWVRISVSVALSADVEVEKAALVAYGWISNGSTNNLGYFKANVEYTVNISDFVGSICARAVGAGATSLNNTWIRR